jgi:hypothetical protein
VNNKSSEQKKDQMTYKGERERERINHNSQSELSSRGNYFLERNRVTEMENANREFKIVTWYISKAEKKNIFIVSDQIKLIDFKSPHLWGNGKIATRSAIPLIKMIVKRA